MEIANQVCAEPRSAYRAIASTASTTSWSGRLVLISAVADARNSGPTTFRSSRMRARLAVLPERVADPRGDAFEQHIDRHTEQDDGIEVVVKLPLIRHRGSVGGPGLGNTKAPFHQLSSVIRGLRDCLTSVRSAGFEPATS
jgi:hypothetical protein